MYGILAGGCLSYGSLFSQLLEALGKNASSAVKCSWPQLTGLLMHVQGQELGYFQYGGSTVITLFRKGAIKYDADLRHNSLQASETLVRMGTSLGIAQ